MQRNDTDKYNINGKLKLCCLLLQSWLDELDNPNRYLELHDNLIPEEEFNTFALTIPATRTRAALKGDVYTIFDWDINIEDKRANTLRRALLSEYNDDSKLRPSNIPKNDSPSIARDLYRAITNIKGTNQDFSTEIWCDDESGFAFNLTGNLRRGLIASVLGLKEPRPIYSLMFRARKKMQKNVDYIADDLGHVTFISQKK